MHVLVRAAAVLAACTLCAAVPSRLAARKRVASVFGSADRGSPDYVFLMQKMTIAGVEVGEEQQALDAAQAQPAQEHAEPLTEAEAEAEAEAEGEGSPKTLHFEGGTVVSVYAPHELDRVRMKIIADHVVNITASEPCHCFCRFKAASGDEHADPMGNVNCLCFAKSGGQPVNHSPQPVPVDMYGERLAAGETLDTRLSYPIPDDVRLVTDGLVLSLDAGDKKSWDAAARQWRDVSGSDLAAALEGHVVWQEDGSGSLRFGQSGDGDRAVVQGLDISPRAHASLSIEVWVKLHSLATPVGYLVGHDNAQDAFDRAIAMHDVRFAGTNAPQGATAVFAGAPYTSSLSSPPVGRWMQVVGVWNQNGPSYLYRDMSRSEGPQLTVNRDGGSALSIGTHQFSPNMFVDASVAVVRVYNRALTEAEVQENFSFLAPRFAV